MGKSLAQEVAELPDAQKNAILEATDPAELLHDWGFWSRPEQRCPEGLLWAIWIYCAGRGAGKTRSAAEWVRDKAKTPGLRIALVGRTSADVRDVIIEGESGIMAVCPIGERPEYEPSKRRLTFPNGTIAQAFSADVPDSLRGPQFHYAWADEAAAWNHVPDASGLTAWDNLRIATRLGEHPQIAVTTTPKRVDMMEKLLDGSDPSIVVTRGTTFDNMGNLSQAYINAIMGVYEGTRLADQELMGIMLDNVEGALWSTELINANRINAATGITPLRVVSVDPSVAENPRDECGIVVVGSTKDRVLHKRTAYVLEDATVHGSPNVWAKRVVEMARKWKCPVVAEINQGGALVENAIRNIDPNIRVLGVHSRKGKALRAEPVVMTYEQHRVHHIGYFAELEAQMTSWVPGETRKSPDRVDALVHGITALMIVPPKGLGTGPLRAKSSAHRSMGADRMIKNAYSRITRAS